MYMILINNLIELKSAKIQKSNNNNGIFLPFYKQAGVVMPR